MQHCPLVPSHADINAFLSIYCLICGFENNLSKSQNIVCVSHTVFYISTPHRLNLVRVRIVPIYTHWLLEIKKAIQMISETFWHFSQRYESVWCIWMQKQWRVKQTRSGAHQLQSLAQNVDVDQKSTFSTAYKCQFSSVSISSLVNRRQCGGQDWPRVVVCPVERHSHLCLWLFYETQSLFKRF